MDKVKIIKKPKPEPKKILIRQRVSRRWSAWVDEKPEMKAGGKTAMAAVGQLIKAHPVYFGIEIVTLEPPPEVKKWEGVVADPVDE
jgi:hypothetical protein